MEVMEDRGTPVEKATEFIETIFPGELCGKVVLDNRMAMIGIVRSIKVYIPSFRIGLIIVGLDSEKDVEKEIPIDVKDIEKIGDNVLLRIQLPKFKVLSIEDVLSLRNRLSRSFTSS